MGGIGPPPYGSPVVAAVRLGFLIENKLSLFNLM